MYEPYLPRDLRWSLSIDPATALVLNAVELMYTGCRPSWTRGLADGGQDQGDSDPLTAQALDPLRVLHPAVNRRHTPPD
jgi:hypothetical protein